MGRGKQGAETAGAQRQHDFGAEEEMNKEKEKKFEELTRPLIKWINEEFNPHAKIIIDVDSAEVVCGEMAFKTDDYIMD